MSSHRDIDLRLRARQLGRAVAPWTALLLFAVALLYLIAPPVQPGLALSATSAAASGCLFAIWIALGRVPAALVHALATAAGLVGVGFALSFVAFTGDASHSVVLIIVLLGTSAVIVYVPAILVVVVAAILGWLLISIDFEPAVRGHWIINLLSTGVLSLLISWTRGRTLRQLDLERREAERARQAIAVQAAELKRARDLALDSARTKSEFLAKITHELRTPLGGIIGLCELVLEGELSLEQRDNVRTSRNAAEALLSIIDDLLEIGRLDSNRAHLRVDEVAVRELVSECLRILEPEAQAKSLALRSRFSDAVPGSILSEPLMLRRVLISLVANSLKFTECGGVEVDVSSPKAGILRISVRDTGIGISATDQKRVWAAFAQGDSSARRKHGGVGLGLAISRGLVELMGGSIALESELGQGTTVHLELPVEVLHEHAAASAGRL